MTYDDLHRALIRTLWNDNLSCAQIAKRFNKAFDANITRSSVIGLANRMKLPKREGGGTWTAEGAAKRIATMKAKGISFGNKPKPPVLVAPVAPSEEPKPLHIEGHCQWLHTDNPAARLFCGHERLAGSPYCIHHSQRAYTPKHLAMIGSSRSARQFGQ